MVEARVPRGDTPAVIAVVTLTPPAIQHAEIDRAIEAGLLPRGAARLQRVLGRIQPHVHTGHHEPRQGHVVALQQDDLADEIRVHGKVVYLPDQVLPGLVVGVGLAGEDDHHRALRVIEQTRQPGRVGKQHEGALVGGETPGETHYQHVVLVVVAIHQAHHVLDDRIAGAIAALLPGHTGMHIFQQLLLERLVHTPVVIVGYLLEPFPVLLVEQLVAPVVETQIEQADPFPGQEGLQVHAVGDIGDRVFLIGYLWPQGRLHLRSHRAVDAADPVVVAAAAQRQAGHVEAVAGIEAELVDLLEFDAQRPHRVGQVFLHHVPFEDVVPGGHRRVGGEHGARRHQFQGGIDVQPLLHAKPAALQDLEGRMALVDMPHRGPQAQGPQRPHPAHSQHQLLLQAHLPVAAVQLVGDGAVPGAVLRQVGIQQVQGDMPRLHRPYPHLEYPPGGFDVDGEVLAARGQGGHYRQVVGLGAGVTDLLVAMAVDGLGEVAHLVQQPYGHERQADIAGGLAVVAGQDAEAARVDRKALVQAELQAEIGDQVFLGIEQLGELGAPPVFPVGVVGGQHLAVVL